MLLITCSETGCWSNARRKCDEASRHRPETRVLQEAKESLATVHARNAGRGNALGGKSNQSPLRNGVVSECCGDASAGTEASVNLYSLIEAARANCNKSIAKLKTVFTVLPKATSADAIEAGLICLSLFGRTNLSTERRGQPSNGIYLPHTCLGHNRGWRPFH